MRTIRSRSLMLVGALIAVACILGVARAIANSTNSGLPPTRLAAADRNQAISELDHYLASNFRSYGGVWLASGNPQVIHVSLAGGTSSERARVKDAIKRLGLGSEAVVVDTSTNSLESLKALADELTRSALGVDGSTVSIGVDTRSSRVVVGHLGSEPSATATTIARDHPGMVIFEESGPIVGA